MSPASSARASSAPSPFRERWQTEVAPKLRAALGQSNPHALPRLAKIVVAAGVGKHRQDAKYVEDVERGLALLTGQKAAARAAKQSIAGFKVREGVVVGSIVTLRGRRMEDFFTRFLRIALPRIRDFRGLPLTAVDRQGNLSVGIREAQAFPEVDPSVVETPFGLQVTMVTSARTRDEAVALYRALGIPFAEG